MIRQVPGDPRELRLDCSRDNGIIGEELGLAWMALRRQEWKLLLGGFLSLATDLDDRIDHGTDDIMGQKGALAFEMAYI